jgi:pimeloyl-ACP methyl ester carboxylesterase
VVAESGTVDVDGGQLHFEIKGVGEPLALALPQSTGPDARRAFLDALARKHTVITYDQRGTGRSSAADGPMSMASQAADFLAVIRSLVRSFELPRVSLLCHSTGCGIGLSAAGSAGRELGRLILIAPWTYADPHLTIMQNLRKAAARSLDPLPYQHFNAALLFPPEYRRAHREGFERMAAEAEKRPQNPREIAARLDAILAFDARPLLERIVNETLIMAAIDDQLMPAWFAEDMAARVSAARYVAFPGGGHMLPETRTDEVVSAITAFMEGSDQRVL